jgi:hypothetical protein
MFVEKQQIPLREAKRLRGGASSAPVWNPPECPVEKRQREKAEERERQARKAHEAEEKQRASSASWENWWAAIDQRIAQWPAERTALIEATGDALAQVREELREVQGCHRRNEAFV